MPHVPIPDTCPGFGRQGAHPYARTSALQTPGGLCPACRGRKRVQAAYARRAAAGLCPRCGKDPGAGRRFCVACVAARRAMRHAARP